MSTPHPRLPRILAVMAAITTLAGVARADHLDGALFEFEGGSAPEGWFPTSVSTVPGYGDGQVLGLLGEETATLVGMDYLDSIALATNDVFLSFDLVLDSGWSGDEVGSESIFRVVGNSQTIVDTTFSTSSLFTQTHPDDLPGGSFPAGTGAVSFVDGGVSVYHFDLRFDLFPAAPGCCTDVFLSFSADFAGSPGTWGLDNVVVSSVPEPESAALWLLGLAGMGVWASRRAQRN